jgi:hypothetical protein
MTADLLNVEYAKTGASTKIDNMGMREMQARAYDYRNAQFLLVKAPPASGKSRALMFIGLDKVKKQGLRKVIVTVPERSIGASFGNTALTKDGFFADWRVKQELNLCTRLGSSGQGTTKVLVNFLEGPEEFLVCTHSTLRFAFEQLGPEAFERVCVAIDEFHHVAAGDDSVLGEVVRRLMNNRNTHIVAMTGSYFRGDGQPILMPEDEAKFTKVSYTYYEQLNGYDHLSTLGIGYHFYRGSYLDAIHEVLDLDKKTIIHIPNVNSNESTRETKYVEVDRIIDILGEVDSFDPATGIHHIVRNDGKGVLKVINLVEENDRDIAMATIRDNVGKVNGRDDFDVIIALNLAKEGFDWVWCEHALTVGYRGSMTEVIQIIGRTTRDAPGKPHAQFTNLIAEPDASSAKVTEAVNNMLKAIACSLLMEQVLAPVFKFAARRDSDELDGTPHVDDQMGSVGTIKVRGLKEPTSERVRQIIETDLVDLKATILQHPTILKAALNPDSFTPEVINQALVPKVIAERYPDLDAEAVEEVRQHFLVDTVVRSSAMEGGPSALVRPQSDLADGDGEDRHSGDNRFVRFAKQFNVADLSIDLIDSINPFQRAYEVLSKSVTAPVLKTIHDALRSTKIEVTEAEAVLMYDEIVAYKKHHGQWPSVDSPNPKVARMGEIYVWLRIRKAQNKAAQEAV